MKIAVLIAGDYREFEHAHKSWKFLDYENIDVYFSTWVVSEVTHKFLNIHRKYVITEDRIRKIVPLVGISLLTDEDPISLFNGSKMIGHWKSAISMMNNFGRTYDIVLLIRPDLFLDLNNQFQDFIENIKSDVLYSVSCHVENGKLLGTQDQFFLGTQKIISRFSNLSLDEYTPDPVHLHHSWLTENMERLFPKVEDMIGVDRYCICRPNTHPDDLTFEQVREKTKSWWEALDPTGQSRYLG